MLSTINEQITSVGKDVEKGESFCTVGGNGDWCNHYGKTVWRFLKKLKIELPHDPTILLMGIYLQR